MMKLRSALGGLLVVGLAAGTGVGFAATLPLNSQKIFVARPANLPPPCTAGSTSVTAAADSWVAQNATGTNYGTDVNLYVQSRSSSQNRRTLVRFNLPTIPTGCTLSSATLRLFAKTASGSRTISVFRAAAAWTESGVTWSNQPSTTGSAVNASSGTGWRSWTVTTHVQNHYSGSNHGFVIRDSSEGASSTQTQNYESREAPLNRPELIVNWS